MIIAVVAVTGAACGPKAVEPPPAGPDRPVEPAGGSTADITAELGPITLEGLVFTPEALPPPAMLLVRARPPQTLAKATAAWMKLQTDTRASKAKRVTAGQILATLLFEEAGRVPEQKRERLIEAISAIQALTATLEVDAATLEMGAALAAAAGDEDAAAKFDGELVRRFPTQKAGAAAQARIAFAHLRAGRNAEATSALAGSEPSEKNPGLAYVIAWSRFRAGDRVTAARAIEAAARGWTDAAYRDPLWRDYLVIASRSDVSPADAAATIGAVFTRPADRFAIVHQLSLAFGFAGRAAGAAAAIDLAVNAGAGDVTKGDLVRARLEQASFAWAAGRVEDIAPALAAANTVLDGCSDCSPAALGGLEAALETHGDELRAVADASQDERYVRAAAAIDALRKGSAAGTSTKKDFQGKAYVDALARVLAARLQGLQACYEATLQAEPKLAGPLTLSIEIDGTGAVQGASSDPAAGTSGLSAVAGCMEQHARTWSLPSRPMKGVSRIKLKLVLASKP